VEEDALAARFDGDNCRAGLGAIVREDASGVEAGLVESLDHRGAQDVFAHESGRGDGHAELRHGDAGVADVSAGGELKRIEHGQPARRGRLPQVHRRRDQVGDDQSEDGCIHGRRGEGRGVRGEGKTCENPLEG
jgi:hypothetical protein